MMNIIIFEDNNTNLLEPFSVNHSPFELRIGGLTNIERIENIYRESNIILIVRDDLKDLIKERFNNYTVNPVEIPKGVCLNAAAIFEESNFNILNKEKSLSNDNSLISFYLDKFLTLQEFRKKIISSSDISIKCDIKIIKYIWDLFKFSSEYILKDFNYFIYNNNNKSHHSLIRVNEDKIHIGNNCIIKAGVILDATNGPIILDDDVVINNGSIIEGPVYLGKNTSISSLSVIKSNTVIGPKCKIGGEVICCNILGYSNKAHEGFLGHSYVGEWVNIGAGTNNSNLKNNYSNIKMSIKDNIVDSKLQFLGSLIGDYSRLAIGTLLNTGAHISFGSNVFNHEFNLKYIPSFSWGNNNKVDIDKFIITINKMKKRRNKIVSEIEEIFIKKLYKNNFF